MKVEIVRSIDANLFRKKINEFIQNKKIIDIKFKEMVVPVGTLFKKELEIVNTAFIIYED